MTTYATGNPLGSKGPRDLYDNAENLDMAANDRVNVSWNDRLGFQRKTLFGMEQQVNDFLIGTAFEPVPLIYVDGSELVVPSPSKLIQRDGNLYSVRLPANFPVTLSGNWASDEPLLTVRSDQALRQQLAQPLGSEMIGRGALTLGEELSKGFPLPVEPPTDLFIIYGQSNSVGWAQNTPGYPAVITNWAKAFDPTNGTLTPVPKGLISSAGQVSTGHGWAEFVNEYVRLTSRKCVIMSCGLGGQSLAALSKPGTIYTQMANAVAACKSAISAAGFTLGKVYAIYNQGEEDAKIGTTKWNYKLPLVTLINNMKADFLLDAFFFQLMGSPRSGFGNEAQLANIHASQREICIEQANTYMASEAAAAFTTGSGMMQSADGVHYTQEGYNYLGRETAKRIANVVLGVNGRQEDSIEAFGAVRAGMRRRWNSVYARIRKDSGGFVLLDEALSSNGYALGFVDTITTGTGAGAAVTLGVTLNNFVVAGESSSVSNLQSDRNGLRPVFRKVTIDAPTAKIGLAVTFNARLSFLVSATGVIRSLRNIASTNNFINANVTASVAGLVVTLSFLGGLEQFPSVSNYGSGSVNVTADDIGPPTTIQLTFSSASALAIVTADVIGIKPESIINGCEFGIGLLAANVGD
ncbi:sialate O-acetylesterase [Pseudomonas aeruginosa]|uniref:sialate O-acetylesterase n=1 Tax=Pseudomonas aeruginosa TaxID=287 RepID=UPI00157FAFAA|nr:sialate O-acetylesterase [Pseudomonas aeruginosa]EKW7238298.1 hypothetical protein [Pseudomonas aeruginosa]MBI8833767.1 hypothetical protein [Pseudomonas aeruginosa]QKR11161.1 sialate O-acetylesterase [Pseudomonas aeruginosa]